MSAETPFAILIIQQNEAALRQMSDYLSSEEYTIRIARNPEDAVYQLEQKSFDLIILDSAMQSVEAGSLLQYIYHNYDNSGIFIISEEDEVPKAVHALRSGADDYMTVPLDEEQFMQSVRRFYKRWSSRQKMSLPSEENSITFDGLIGESDAMKKVYESIMKSAHVHETVLITGESGTGKDVVARTIHEVSGIPGDFVPVNCGGIPTELLESELFGHEKGAYTGAYSEEQGFFQAAHNGTLFLDEIGNTSTAMQAKLLRVLENTQVWKVGSREPDKINVRVIAATNVHLKDLVDKGLFREDLYYRLNVIRIPLPPLRDRDSDVLLLTKYFIEKYASEMCIEPPEFSDEVLNEFLNSEWPGNVRQLQNTIKRLLMKERTKITFHDLPDSFRNSHTFNFREKRSLEEMETEHILRVLEQMNWNKTQAAKVLGITRKTLLSKIKRKDLGQRK
ncbi:MAG: response regulator [Candidatus Marinimicrobia bacterium]|nr:response regulator [Candidatus Neomarinimicrobiota bacterium]